MKQKRTLHYAAIAVILAFGLYLLVPRTNNTVTAPTTQEQVTEISYKGEDGKTAFELLDANYDIETKQYDFGPMVLAINGRKANSDEFWAFYVNGELAQVGAAEYQTKATDTITWKLEKIK
jgi:hypothetical protein